MDRKALTLAEAESLAGPGWSPLVWSAWEVIRDLGGHLYYVGERMGALELRYELGPMSDGDRALAQQFLRGLERDSRSTCSTCGRRGQLTPVAGGWRTLCHSCWATVEAMTDRIVERTYEQTLNLIREPDTERWGAHWDPERDAEDDRIDGEEKEPWQ